MGAIRVANTVGAAVTNHRTLGRSEGRILLLAGVALAIVAVLATIWPRVVATPLAILALWIGVALIWRSSHLTSRHDDALSSPPDTRR